MKETILVLAAQRWDIEATKERSAAHGAKITYLSGRPTKGDTMNLGIAPNQVNAPFTVFLDMDENNTPGWYEAEFSQRPGRNAYKQQVVTLYCEGLRFLGPLNLTQPTSKVASNGVGESLPMGKSS
jgi:hypothetical protein